MLKQLVVHLGCLLTCLLTYYLLTRLHVYVHLQSGCCLSVLVL